MVATLPMSGVMNKIEGCTPGFTTYHATREHHLVQSVISYAQQATIVKPQENPTDRDAPPVDTHFPVEEFQNIHKLT